MKKLLCALAVLALVMVLLPAQEARAEAPVCPICGRQSFMGVPNWNGTHCWACNNTGCTNFGTKLSDPEPCTGGEATCTKRAVCEVCREEYGEPLDHDWATTLTKGDTTHYYACSRCDAKKDEAEHSYEWTYVDDDTCKGVCVCGAETTEAHYDRWASYCGRQPHCEKCDHDYGEIPEHEMIYEYRSESGHKPSCKHCDTYFFLEAHSGGTATCTAKAKCEKCGEEYGDFGEHTGGEATCTEKAVCEVCSQPYGEVDPDNHDLIDHEAQEPTCTEIGWDAYQTCSRCDYTTYVEKPALGHTEKVIPAVAPACSDTGLTEGKVCSVCKVVLQKRYIVPALGHDLVNHEAQETTCTEIGWEAYDTCSRCDYTTYVEKPALGHDLVNHEAQEPTCTEIGWEAYDTCSRCDYTTYVEKPALGHTEEVIPAVAPTCTATGLTEGRVCSVCEEILVEQEAIEANGHLYCPGEIAAAPTCVAAGKQIYNCYYCDAAIMKDVGEAEPAAHVWCKGWTIAPTCVAAGRQIYNCYYCDAAKSEKVGEAEPAKHTWCRVTVGGKAIDGCYWCDATKNID